jgi:hypothetical protein
MSQALERIAATSVANPDLQAMLTVTGEHSIGMGYEEKRLVTAYVSLGHNALSGTIEEVADQATVTMLERSFHITEGYYSPIHFIKNWKAHREADIPTSPALYTTDSPDKLLVTDVKADGSETYGKGRSNNMLYNQETDRPRPKIDELFLGITADKNLLAIEAKALEYARRATSHNLVLATDDPLELIVHPDGTWDFIALDLTNALTPEDAPYKNIDMELADKNAESIDYLMGWLQKIHDQLAKPSKPGIAA